MLKVLVLVGAQSPLKWSGVEYDDPIGLSANTSTNITVTQTNSSARP